MDEREFFQTVADHTQLSGQEAADLTPRHSRGAGWPQGPDQQ
ncbi:hypothetical protein AB0M05_30330 [Streptomyces violaceusniger]